MTYDVNKQTVTTDNTYSWKYKEITSLIEAYRLHKDKFESRKDTPKSIWEQISAELKKNNILKSSESCEKKWKSLLKFTWHKKNRISNLTSLSTLTLSTVFSVLNKRTRRVLCPMRIDASVQKKDSWTNSRGIWRGWRCLEGNWISKRGK